MPYVNRAETIILHACRLLAVFVGVGCAIYALAIFVSLTDGRAWALGVAPAIVAALIAVIFAIVAVVCTYFATHYDDLWLSGSVY